MSKSILASYYGTIWAESDSATVCPRVAHGDAESTSRTGRTRNSIGTMDGRSTNHIAQRFEAIEISLPITDEAR